MTIPNIEPSRIGTSVQRSSPIVLILLLSFGLPIGCAHSAPEAPPPTFSATSGAIAGTLTNSSGEALSSADKTALAGVQIRLVSADAGLVATAEPGSGKTDFAFSDVRPGRYEISVYNTPNSKSTVAGSHPVTVDPNQITRVSITVQITSAEDGPKP